MTNIVVRPAEVSDIESIAQLRSIGFGTDAAVVRAHIKNNPRYTIRDIVMADVDGESCGTACAFSAPMWLSGVPVSMGAVAGVTTHPRYRMKGVAKAMMLYLMRKMADDGLAISTLFPAEHTMYYRYGYGEAAIWHHYSINPQNIPFFDEISAVRPYRDDDRPALQSLYRGTQLSRNDGRLSRPTAWWERFTDAAQRTGMRRLMVFDDDGVAGYVKLVLDAKKTLRINELVAHTDAAYRGLWAYVAAQPEVTAIKYHAPADEPLYHLLNTPTDSFGGGRGWIFNDIFHATSTFMLRVINLAQALTERFYPANLQGQVTLKIADPQLPHNSTPLQFRVVDGRAETHPASADAVDVETDIITFSKIYCGFLHPAHARRLGKLTAGDAAVEWLGRAMATRPLYIHPTDWF